ncbi:urethanase-like [Oculina patagonica]
MATNPTVESLIREPSVDEIRALSGRMGFVIKEEDISAYQEAIVNALRNTYQPLCKLTEPSLPVKYPRKRGYRPAPEENPCNAWYWRCNLVGAPNGKLLGKTIAIKDNIPVAGVPMMSGSRMLEDYVPDYDATVVSRILDAGGQITGKAVCEEWCFTATSCTAATGPVVNPHDQTRMALGSSSGSAALVAGGHVDIAMGGDQGGSIRIPAAACGIVGLKPTYGLVPYTGIVPVDLLLDHTGPMARTVKDVALLLEVVAGLDGDRDLDPRQPRDLSVPTSYISQLTGDISRVRIGVLREGFEMPGADTKIMAFVKEAAGRFSTRGASVEEVSVPMHFDGIRICDVMCMEGGYRLIHGFNSDARGFVDTSLQKAIGRGFETRANDVAAPGKVTLMLGAFVHENYHGAFHGKAVNLARKLCEEYDKVFESYDVLVLPTIIKKPPKAVEKDEMDFGTAFDFCQNTGPFNVTGHPALSINAGFSDGLPVGMMIVGRKFDEATVLNVAYAYERIRDGYDQ